MGVEIIKQTLTPGSAISPPQQVSTYYYASQASATTGTAAGTASRLEAVPFWVPETTTYDRIGAEVTTNAAATTVRLGFARDNQGVPGDITFDAGTIDGSTTNAFKEITINHTLTPGLWWILSCRQGGTPTMRSIAGGLSVCGGTASSLSGTFMGYGMNSVTGAFPASFTIDTTITSAVRVLVRKA